MQLTKLLQLNVDETFCVCVGVQEFIVSNFPFSNLNFFHCRNLKVKFLWRAGGWYEL